MQVFSQIFLFLILFLGYIFVYSFLNVSFWWAGVFILLKLIYPLLWLLLSKPCLWMFPYSEITKVFWYVFPSKLHSFSFMFRFITLIKLFFVDSVRYKSRYIFFFGTDRQVVLHHLLQRLFLSLIELLLYLCWKSVGCMCGVHFWSLCSLPFICILTLIWLFSLLYFCQKSQG